METGDGNEGVEIETYAENGDRTEAQEKNVILVVEDHPDMRKHICRSLDPLFTVVEAGDGKEGITKAKEIIQGLETGADDYITKPFNTKILHTRIKNLIELRRQLQLKIQRQKMLLPAKIEVSSMDEAFLKEFQQIIEKNLSDLELNIDTLCKKLYIN